ncbi:MAG: hypothetical protein ACFB10_21530 [Salibacteraceae bacterium]
MSKTSIAILFLFSLIMAQGVAQTTRTWIGIETDPITTAFGARTLSAVVEPPKVAHWSLFLNVVRADFPGWMDDFLNPQNQDKGFESRVNIGGGFAVDYFLNEDRKGTYFGLVQLFFENKVSRNQASQTLLTHNLIPRVGYRWYPFSKANLYLNPFAGLRYEYAPRGDFSVDGTAFEAAGFQPFGTLHLGYHF